MVRVRRRPTVDRTGVTELPRLTSDPVFTADRRGGILISFGLQCTTFRVINPSKWTEVERRSNLTTSNRGVSFASHSNTLIYLRASERPNPRNARAGLGRWERLPTTTSRPNALLHIRASDSSRRGAAISRRHAYFNPNTPLLLRASNRDRRQHVRGTATGRPRVTESASATFASHRMAGIHKRPSNRDGFVMRFHARTIPVSPASQCGTFVRNRSASTLSGDRQVVALNGEYRAAGGRLVIPRSHVWSGRVVAAQ